MPDAPRREAARPEVVGDPRLELLDRITDRRASRNWLALRDAAKPDEKLGAVLRFLGGADDLERRFGCRVLAAAGGFFVALVPPQQLTPGGALLRHPALIGISLARALRPQSGAAGTGATMTERAPRALLGLRPQDGAGKGVRLAVIDTVLDTRHPAFGRRIAWLWDAGATPPDPALPMGVRYRRSALPPLSRQTAYDAAEGGDAVLARSWKGHGTAVAGIATGAPGGVAPEADVVFASAGRADDARLGDSVDLLTAAGLVLDAGDDPVIANLSSADCLGPHDGTLLGERFLDELLLRPGRALVISAGNNAWVRRDANHGLVLHDHAQVDAVPGAVTRLELQVVRELPASDAVEVWFSAREPPRVRVVGTAGQRHDGQDASLVVRLSAARDRPSIARPMPANFTGPPTLIAALAPGGPARGGLTRWCFSLLLGPGVRRGQQQAAFPRGDWRIFIEGAEGEVHGWVDRNNRGQIGWCDPVARRDWLAHTVGAPATARRVLAVAGTGPDGKPLSGDAGAGQDVGSGRGPCLGGARKPDLAAPGSRIAVPLPGEPEWTDGGAGTSFAAPLVAGTIALLFERWGAEARHATCAEIRQAILPRGRRWSADLGAGLLDARAALDPPRPRVDVWIPRTASDRAGSEPLPSELPWGGEGIALQGDPLAGPVRLAVTIRNRGSEPARDVLLRVAVAPAGLAAPLPAARRLPAGWTLLAQPPAVERIAAGGRRVLTVAADLRALLADGPVTIAAVVSCEGDKPPADAAPTSCNNIALLPVAPAGVPARFIIEGDGATDGLALIRAETGRFRLRLPMRALPWRSAALFEHAALAGQVRPYVGESWDDPAEALTDELAGDLIRIRTDIEGASSLAIRDGVAVIESRAARLWLPRLRLRPNARMHVIVERIGRKPGLLHAVAFSDGRRTGGGSASI